MMLEVLISGVSAGRLLCDATTGVVSFVVDEDYAEMADRPVLGQQFEERREHRIFRQSQFPGNLPAFFANLLPEGALRTLMKAQFSSATDLDTLGAVGADLPGAVEVRQAAEDATVPALVKTFDEPSSLVWDGERLRMSLAGAQIKLPAVESGGRFAVPARGLGGTWILKFASEQYPRLPENEFATMSWAAEVGFNVPIHKLLRTDSISGLDDRFRALGESVYAIKRYDRLADGSRVHQEDFAQVRGIPPVPPERKYSGASLEGLARFVGDLCGQADLEEFLNRMVFAILCGNTDAHLKNWSLIYPDGRAARLAPMYDFVFVRQYIADDTLALPIANERVVERVGWGHLARAGKYLRKYGHPVDVEETARRSVTRCLDAWTSRRGAVPADYRDSLDRYLKTLPLVSGTEG